MVYELATAVLNNKSLALAHCDCDFAGSWTLSSGQGNVY